MGNRKLPFGYRMEMGVEVIHPEEARLVQAIFTGYLAGESFKQLAESMTAQPIPYDEGKTWNKNMIARMLEDCRYTGDKGFPAIIEAAVFRTVAERRKGQQCPIHRTEVDKALRQLCGHPPTAKISAQVLAALNSLIREPASIQAIPPPSRAKAASCRRELDQVLTQFPVDEDRANTLVRQSAVLHYQSIGPSEYETECLKRIFTAAQPMEQLDVDLLRSTVASIATEQNNVVSIRLKNQQVIEGRTAV